MLFLGVDWGEHHHDLCLLDQDGNLLAARRIADGPAGVGELHALLASHAEDPAQVVVGIETDRGLLVGVLLAAGYQVYAVNPQAVSRYRGRMAAPGPSPTGATPRCWPTWSAPTGTTTAKSPATARWSRRSRCWPGPTRIWSGAGIGTPTRCAAPCGSSTPGRWPPRRPAGRTGGA